MPIMTTSLRRVYCRPVASLSTWVSVSVVLGLASSSTAPTSDDMHQVDITSSCPNVQPQTCLPTSLPILQTIDGLNATECCAACQAHPSCQSWTLRVSNTPGGQHGCYVRATYDKAGAKAGADCTSGSANRPLPPPPPPAPPGSPNVLLMLVDDLRPWLPFYGADRIVAPNLAKLAASGVQFNNSYVNQAVCSPTRNSFMSGRTPDHTRLWNFQGSFRTNGLDASGKPGSEWKSLPQVFKDQGWITAGCGKTFHPGSPPNWDAPYSWSTVPGTNTLLYPYVDPDEQIAAQGTLLTPQQASRNLDAATGSCCDPNTAEATSINHPHFFDTVVAKGANHSRCQAEHPAMRVLDTTVCDAEGVNTTDYQTASIAIDHLQNLTAQKQPWFLAVGLHKPHPYWPLPLNIREQYLDLPLPDHKLAPIGMPPVAFVSCDYLQNAYDVNADVGAGRGILPNVSLPDDLARKIRSGYAAGVTWMDQQAGRVLDALDALGAADNTIVLFTADHGWGLGEHGIWCKYCVFENQVRVPMIVRVPWMKNGHGQSTSALVEHIDIMPTLADLAGILPKVLATEALDGQSFASVVNNPSSVHKNAAFSQYPRCMNSTMAQKPPYTPNRDPCVGHPPNEFTHMGLSVRTDLYRYSEWFRWRADCSPDWTTSDGVELYSHVNDTTPGCFDCFENVNLAGTDAGRKQYATIIAQHRQLLFARYEQANATSCPPPTSHDELVGTDPTFEDVPWMFQ
eukprot:m.190238 g.190238  ORF g.190238 m.190238 type:complete len:737 (-) comp17994_c0_seq1:155-2365(-)